MKKCPYCAEEIQNEAILCRFCRKDLSVALPKNPQMYDKSKSGNHIYNVSPQKEKRKLNEFSIAVIIAIPILCCCVGILLLYTNGDYLLDANYTDPRIPNQILIYPTATLIRQNKIPTTSTKLNSPSGEFTPLVGRIWSGVKVYFGINKAYGFEILGFADNCDSICDECILVEFPNGNTGWKERSYLVNSGIFFVKNNDPALDAHEAWGYPCP